MKNNKIIETTLIHEFWCCKREYLIFISSVKLLNSTNSKKEFKIIAFTSYGNFLRHLYVFYEGIIQIHNKNLIKPANEKQGEQISLLLTEEVRKLIRNKKYALQEYSQLNIEEIIFPQESEVSQEFGTYLRQIRNRFSHINTKRIHDKEISLADFYKLYHKYVLLLFESAAFTWEIEAIDKYDWLEIENFMEYADSK